MNEPTIVPPVAEKQRATGVPDVGFQNLETRRWPYLIAAPFSNALSLYVMSKKRLCLWWGRPAPVVNTLWFDGLGPDCRGIRQCRTSWQAMDIIYNHQFGKKSCFGDLIDDFWIGMVNAQAVRNRLKIAKVEIDKAVSEFAHQGEPPRLLSLAAGAAQGVIEIMAKFNTQGVKVKALLLDIDESGLAYARELARRYGVEAQIDTVKADVFNVEEVSKEFRPQVIEMLGLLDYLPQEKAITLAQKVHASLEPHGIFMTCNIHPNFEQLFLKWVIDWSMVYRTPSQLLEVLEKAEFSECRLVTEPLKVHSLVIGRKRHLQKN